MIVDRLQSAAVLGMEHGEVEGLISREGTELMRRLLQGHLDVRAAAETREAGVRGADGVVRSQVRAGCRRHLMTLFGEVEVRCCGFSAPEEESLFPLDGALNLPKDSYSHGLRERLAFEVARGSFVMRKEDLREGTKRAAERESHKLKTPSLAGGEA